jgi:adenylate cyclase
VRDVPADAPELPALAARLGGLPAASVPATQAYRFTHPRAACAFALRANARCNARITLKMDDEAALHFGRVDEQPAGVVATQRVATQLAPGLDADIETLELRRDTDGASPHGFALTAPSFAEPEARSRVPSASDFRPTLVILPFDAPGLAPDAIGIGDVVSDQLTGLLSASSLLNVVSRLSAVGFRGRATSVPEIARMLGADFVVSGSCWQDRTRVRACVELASARTHSVLWSRTLSDSRAGVLRGDGDMLQALAEQIMGAIVDAQIGRARRAGFERVEDHALLLGAIGLIYRLSLTDFAQARPALETLLDRAPKHALPRAWLARWHLFRVVQGWSADRDADGRAALDHARRALDIDEQTSYLRDLDEAERLYARASEVNPNESLNWLQWGNARSFRGDGNGALAHVGRAISLSPLDPARHFYESIQASAALTAGEMDLAIDAARRSLRLNASHVSTHRVLAIALSLSGRIDEARPVVRRILELEPALTVEGFIAR